MLATLKFDWVMQEPRTSRKAKFYTMNNSNNFGENAIIETISETINKKFLTRQVKLSPQTNEESFRLITNTILQAKGQPLEIIATPGVDKLGNAYFFVGLRINRHEVDLKLSVNEAMVAMVLAFMCGSDKLLQVDDLNPMKISAEEKIAWYQNLERQMSELKAVRKEKIEVTEYGTYMKVTYKLPHGKITINHGKVENLMQLLTA